MDKKLEGEKLAAVCMALHEYRGFTTHDSESGVLGMQQDDSAWSTKLATVRQLPSRKF